MTKKYTWEVCEGDCLFYEDGAVIDYDDVCFYVPLNNITFIYYNK